MRRRRGRSRAAAASLDARASMRRLSKPATIIARRKNRLPNRRRRFWQKTDFGERR
jgi:hypothetical protein